MRNWNRRRRWRGLIAALLTLAALSLGTMPLGARGETWPADRDIHCRDHRPGCRLLQMVMMGSFDDADDTLDAVSRRVLASAWPRLCEVTEEDIIHFAGEFGEDEAMVHGRWYGAMAGCLRADILADSRPEARLDAAQRVLLLFLDPDVSADAGAEQDQIRLELNDEALARLADAVGAPVDFVRWLITEK